MGPTVLDNIINRGIVWVQSNKMNNNKFILITNINRMDLEKCSVTDLFSGFTNPWGLNN